jgi:purine catabolism regulator
VSVDLAYVLELEIFKRGNAEVAAGQAELGRPVRWVHISELPHIAYYIKGGELLMTTGMALAGDPLMQRRFIRELDEVGAAGVVLELGTTFKKLPRALKEEAVRCGFPLIVLHNPTPYVEVTEQVHSAIINRQYELLMRAESIGRTFNELLLDGVPLQRLLIELAGLVGNPVVLEDAAHQVVDFAFHGQRAEYDLLGEWSTHSRVDHDQSRAGIRSTAQGLPCLWTELLVRGQEWGRLHVPELNRQLDEMDRLAIDKASSAVAIYLLSEREASNLVLHAGSALISDILSNRFTSEGFVRRAQSLGVDFSDRRLIVLVLDPQIGETSEQGRGLPETERQAIRSRVLAEMRRALDALSCTGVCAAAGDRTVAILAYPESQKGLSTATDVAELSCKYISDWSPNLRPLVGVSDEGSPHSVRLSVEQAVEAVEYGLRSSLGSTVYRFGNLGVDHLLVRLSEGADLARFVESELGALLLRDSGSKSPLLATLKAYLDASGNKVVAARELHVERRSLYHRLDRIKEILGHDFDNEEARVRLWIAIKGLETIQRRANAGGIQPYRQV